MNNVKEMIPAKIRVNVISIKLKSNDCIFFTSFKPISARKKQVIVISNTALKG